LTRQSTGENHVAAPPRSTSQEETQLSDDKPLLVFFTSERSGPARRMESLLAHLARKERTRVRIMRVAVEDQPELAERFKVTDVPTLVLVKRKRVVDRLDGRASAPKIETMLARHLPAPAAAA
jgi:thioredoxin 1